MKKKVSLIAIAAAIMFCMTGCGKFTCDMCGEEKSGRKHETEWLGATMTICDECHDGINDGLDALGDLF